MTRPRKVRRVRAWANLNRDGTIDPGFVSCVRGAIEMRSKVCGKPYLRVVRVEITPILPRRRKTRKQV